MFSQKIFNNNVCYISGLHRSGKSLLTAILPSLEKSGLINKDPTLNLISQLYMNKEASLNLSRYLIRFIISNTNYSNFIGRKINLKKTDETSIFHHINYNYYLKKLTSKRKIKKPDKIFEKKINFFDIHNILYNLKLWHNIDKNFKLINIDRNPIDLAYSWHSNKFGTFKKSSINQLLLYQIDKKLVPAYAKSWSNKYVKMSEIDRIIEIIYDQTITSNKNIKFFKMKRHKILLLKYEEILNKPYENLSNINKFLNLNSKIMFNKYKHKILISSEKLNDLRSAKLKKIKKLSTFSYFNKLIKLEKSYNESKI